MKRYVLALGMFDGVHLGHRALLTRTAQLARAHGGTAVAFTFQTHPRALFGDPVAYVTAPEEKEKLCLSCGIDRVDAVSFTQAFAGQSPEAFIAQLLRRYDEGIDTIVCGYDFRFGADAAGNPETLARLGERFGFSVEAIAPVLYRGLPCSSTRVREAVARGDLDEASDMLGRPFWLSGTVVSNRGIGRTLGFPTANLDCTAQVLPPDGVYAGAAVAGGRLYPAVTNIGSNPTVGGTARTVETHLPDRTIELYGERVTALLLQRLRGEKRFDSTATLARQIERDAAAAKKVFAENEKRCLQAVKIMVE